jgi:adenosine deaminase/adenosine deaminase CECR1
MTIRKKLFFIALLVSFAGCSGSAYDNQRQTSRFYESMFHGGQADVAKLNLFFTRMPKGGDLHHHYTGSIYAETYLDWVEKKGWWINPCTLRIATTREIGDCTSVTVPQLVANNTLYRRLLTLWSDMDYGNHFHDQPPPDSNFFSTFGYFGTVSNEYMQDGLDIIKQRAINENVNYIETMLTSVPVKGAEYFRAAEADKLNVQLRDAESPEEVGRLLDQITVRLGSNDKFLVAVDGYVSRLTTIHQGIDTDAFTMRFQSYASRVSDPLQVFASLYAGFMASSKSPLIVGVNIVAPENNVVALADYTLHMRMFDYLHQRYPNVNRALHAGELTLGMVKPDDLLFHIRQALEIAHAQRIGHGVDLPYEQNATKLLAALKKNDTAIEINLTSNQFILGVAGKGHPYLIYSGYGVPLVISTDDSGVSRNNLSNEYMLLASRYHPSYAKIKEYVYNSIKYSFLSQDEKASAKNVLDNKFTEFEKEMAGLGDR